MSGSHNAHSTISPSGSKRWISCPASVRYIVENADRIPADDISPYAAEGTQAHDYAEAVQTGKMKIGDVPAEFRIHVADYVRYCNAVTPEGAAVLVEKKTPLWYKPDDYGTVDFAAVAEGKIVMVDLKYGQGVLVEAVENTQLAIYARSLIEDLDFLYGFNDSDEVELHIYQPRHRRSSDSGDVPADCWGLTVGELKMFTASIGAIAEDILKSESSEQLPFGPSEDACRWCPAKGFCVARISESLDLLPDDLDPLETDKPEFSVDSYTDADLVRIHVALNQLSKIGKDITEYLTDRAVDGNPAPGTKLVLGREGNRTWVDSEEALMFLNQTAKLKMDDAAPRQVVSPAQAEKLLKERLRSTRFLNAFEKRIKRAPAKPVLALESDKRPAISSQVAANEDLLNELDEI